MAVVAIDGFDTYNGVGANTGVAARWSRVDIGGSATITMVPGRFGGQAQSCNYTQATASFAVNRYFFPAALTSLTAGFALRYTQTTGAASVGRNIRIGTTLGTAGIHLSFRVGAGGVIEAYRGDGTVLLGTSTACIVTNSWHFVEIEMVISDTIGRITIFCDNVQVLNLTGIDTANTATVSANHFDFGQSLGNGSFVAAIQIDDFYVDNTATRLGERRVETLYPTSDGATLNWVPSTGTTGFGVVDEPQVNTTDWLSASTIGDVEELGMQDLTGVPTTIDAVQVSIYGIKTDAAARSIALGVKSGATNSDGTNYSLNASYSKFERIMTVDPNGSIPWTATNINALQARPKVTV